jgi:hypothetical protein
MLFKILQNASLENRGGLLRQICIIDEHLKQINENVSSKSREEKYLKILFSCIGRIDS